MKISDVIKDKILKNKMRGKVFGPKTREWSAFLIRNREFLGSDIGTETIYLTEVFRGFVSPICNDGTVI